MRNPGVATLAGLTLAGCPALDNPYLPYPEPDYDVFVARIQPIVQRSCAELGCHGDPQQTLTLYARDYLRAQPEAKSIPLSSELTDFELAWNYDALRLRILDEPDADHSRLLLKTLDPEAGGIVHAGGIVVWDSPEAPDYQTLRDWIAGGL